ncbi:unnamed protein product [Rotaria sp. Silwood1]|nr:unnamed protein product [Rotaria sp. Silwood1]CAF1205823.1 unnamed protein product [Rotaria sp. Silwood1]CAF1209585.1 unnamed protein product [Rotaria sp. Silwood1]CAF3503002.1 unnamed protein product [Rotaria sp. Silwood1]CAF3506049.1 unnamed protein product [Rotaria sp. Silwood1]
MPTVFLIDCSLGMAERFSYVISQWDNMTTTINIEKRSLVAKMIESLMTNTNSLTKLETIALVLFSGPAIDFAKKFLTTTFGTQRSQKILVFTDSSHRDDNLTIENNNNNNNAMDIDLRKQIINDEQEKISSSNSHTEVSFVCIRKPSGTDRARLENISEQAQCSLSKIYWLINREKENNTIITNEMIQDVITQIKADMLHIFISTLKCDHYESQLTVYSTIKPAVLHTTGEIFHPSNTLTVNSFIELSSIHSARATSKHIHLPIQCYTRPQSAMPMFATKKSAVVLSSSPTTTTSFSLTNQKKSNAANNSYYLLLISLKKEISAALISVNDQCFERLGPYAHIFPPGNNGELVYKKQPWPVKPFARSYTETFLIWCRQNNFQNDINKFVSASAKLPNKELNKICRGAFIYGLRERLFRLLQQLFQRQIQMGKMKPDGIRYVQNVINYMNRLSSSDRFIKYEETSS